MFVASSHNTMRNAKFSPAMIEDRAVLKQQRDSLRIECEAKKIELAEAEARIAALRREADSAISAANEALRLLHEKWAAQEAKKPHMRKVAHPIRVEDVVRRICKATGVSMNTIMSNRRDKEATFVRQAICYWAVRRTSKTLPQIGTVLNRDHTTIMHNRDAYVAKRKAMGRTLRMVR